jgi:hypothetical protein
MHWSYADLLALPAWLYPELVDYLNDSAGKGGADAYR